MANKGGSLLENVGMLVAPQTTQGFLTLPALKEGLAQRRDQSSALSELIAGLGGKMPTQDLNVTGDPRNAMPTRLSMGRSMDGTGPAQSSMSNFLTQQAPQLAMRADPESTLKAFQSTLIDAPQKVELAPGASVGTMTRRGGYTNLYTNPAAPTKADTITLSAPGKQPVTLNLSDPADLGRFNVLKTQGYAEVKTPAAMINMPGSERSYDMEIGKQNANAYGKIQEAGAAAIQEAPGIDRLDSLLSQIDTNSFKGTTADLKAKAKALGVDLGAIGIADDTDIVQAAKALTNEQALQLRNPAGGAGMPGAMSDADREYLASMGASIDKAPGANKMIVDARRKLNKRSRDVAALALKYTRENGGRFDQAGFQGYLSDWADKNPLFPKVEKSAEPKAEPKPTGNVLSELPSDAVQQPDGTYRSPSYPGKIIRPQAGGLAGR